jgi:hypothetical protein
MARSPVGALYNQSLDRASAFETLKARAAQKTATAVPTSAPEPAARREPATPRPRASNRQTIVEAAAKSLVRSVASSLGRELLRGALGSLRRR